MWSDAPDRLLGRSSKRLACGRSKPLFDDTGTPLQRSLLLTPSSRANLTIEV
jgi:hypothetical protein